MLKLFTFSRKHPVTHRPRNVADGASAPESSAPVTETYWSRRRRPQLDHESRLSGWTRTWLEALPEHLRPTQLSSCHPHVANRLALSWRDPMLTEHAFEDLLVDRRAGRKGFAPAVVDELLRLREFHDQRRGAGVPPVLDEPQFLFDPQR